MEVIVKANSKKEKVEFNKEKNLYIVSVKSEAKNNKANLDVIKLMSKFLKKPVKIVKGFKSKKKVIDIL